MRCRSATAGCARPPGRHALVVTCSQGRSLINETITIAPFAAQTRAVQPSGGELTLRNRSGTQLTIEVDGQVVATLSPGESAPAPLAAGQHTVEALYWQHGRDRKLSEQTVALRPGAHEVVQFSPADHALVRIDNALGKTARVAINGQDMGSVAAGKSRVVSAPVGIATIVLRIGGRVAMSTRLDIDRYADNTVRAAARTGSLALSNPLPIAVRLVSGGQEQILQPGQRLTLRALPEGAQRVDVFRLEGERIGQLTARISASQTARLTIAPPSEGIVALHNRTAATVRIIVDGRQVDTVGAWDDERLSLSAGTHQIKAITPSRSVLYSRTVRVDRYDASVIHLGGSSGHVRPDDAEPVSCSMP